MLGYKQRAAQEISLQRIQKCLQKYEKAVSRYTELTP